MINRTIYVILYDMGNRRTIGGYPPYLSEGINPPDERKEGEEMNYVTYTDLIQFCIFIIALVGLCYTIFKGKK